LLYLYWYLKNVFYFVVVVLLLEEYLGKYICWLYPGVPNGSKLLLPRSQ